MARSVAFKSGEGKAGDNAPASPPAADDHPFLVSFDYFSTPLICLLSKIYQFFLDSAQTKQERLRSNPPLLLTAKDAAVILGIGETKFREWDGAELIPEGRPIGIKQNADRLWSA